MQRLLLNDLVPCSIGQVACAKQLVLRTFVPITLALCRFVLNPLRHAVLH